MTWPEQLLSVFKARINYFVEVFQKMTSLIDKFTTNSLQTPLGLMISRASDEVLPCEDWSLIMEICDYVNTREEGPKDAARAIRKRLQVTKTTKSIMYTLIILETCMKNCGYRFQINICQKDFIQDMVKLLQPSRNPSLSVQEKIVTLIQNWTDAFSSHPDLKGVAYVHEELRMKGIIFPDSDKDEVKLLRTAGGVGFGTPAVPADFPIRSASLSRPSPANPANSNPPMQSLPRRAQSINDGPTSVPASTAQNSGTLTQSQTHKLQRDLDVVQTNCRILSDMLSQLTPGQEEPAEYALLKDLNAICRQMQSRLVELIEQVSSEEITCELLRVNDDLNQVFVRYDRYERVREVHMKKNLVNAQNSVLSETGQPQPVAPIRNKSLTPDDLIDGPLLPVGSSVPVVKKKMSDSHSQLPPIRASNMPQLSNDMSILTLEDPDEAGGAVGGFSSPSANAASNPTYEELMFTASTQSPGAASNTDAFGISLASGGDSYSGKQQQPSEGKLSEQDIDAFLDETTGSQSQRGPVVVKPAQSFLNPFES